MFFISCYDFTSGQKYNTARGHLKFLQSENGVLSRTLEVVQKQLKNEKGKLKELEEIHGVSGFAELQSKLEEVSGMKQKKDEQKGTALSVYQLTYVSSIEGGIHTNANL